MEDTEIRCNTKELGGSLPVPNVQELASNDLQNVPHRYIRPEINPDEVSTDGSSQIPVIDMAKLTPDHPGYELESSGMRGMGLFSVHHGAYGVIEKMKVVIDEFFKLPLQQKMAYQQLPNSIEGYGQAFFVSEDQKLDWGDMFFIVPLPITARNLRFWPNVPTTFRSTFDEYSSALHKVCINLIKSIAANLGLDTDQLGSMYQDGSQGIRMNFYPPCRQADNVYGLAPHSDAVGLTLLVQANEVEGLQIRKNNKWLPIKPIPGAIIINIGDILEAINPRNNSLCDSRAVYLLLLLGIFNNTVLNIQELQIQSNGKYRSIEHRAVFDYQRERLSIAAFHSPSMTAKIGPLHLIDEEKAKYKTMVQEDYIRSVIKSKLDGKRLLD